MNRRNFFKSIFVFSMAPAIVKAENIMKINPHYNGRKNIYNDFIVDAISKEIQYIGTQGHNYSVLELHRYLSSLADRPYMSPYDLCIIDDTPSIRHTDNLIEIPDSYKIDKSAIKHLNEGIIINNNEIFSYVSPI